MISKQVQGRAEGKQVPDAKIGLCHNLGGAFSVCATTILGFFFYLSSLETLRLNGSIRRISYLRALENLKELDLSKNQITKIEGLETLTNLTSLNLRHYEITEIKGLDLLLGLEKIDLMYNMITEIKGLENLINLKDISIYQLKNLIPHDLIKEIGGDEWHTGQKLSLIVRIRKKS